jgi:hypothetical protein
VALSQEVKMTVRRSKRMKLIFLVKVEFGSFLFENGRGGNLFGSSIVLVTERGRPQGFAPTLDGRIGD